MLHKPFSNSQFTCEVGTAHCFFENGWCNSFLAQIQYKKVTINLIVNNKHFESVSANFTDVVVRPYTIWVLRATTWSLCFLALRIFALTSFFFCGRTACWYLYSIVGSSNVQQTAYHNTQIMSGARLLYPLEHC